MSLTGTRDAVRRLGVAKVTPQSLLAQTRSATIITAITACDYPTARLVDEAGIDLLLVGDSLEMAVLGHEDTLAVTTDEMLHHARTVRRAVKRALLVVDMPFGSYQLSVEDTLRNAIRLVKESGCEAVRRRCPVRACASAYSRTNSGRRSHRPHAAIAARYGRLSCARAFYGGG